VVRQPPSVAVGPRQALAGGRHRHHVDWHEPLQLRSPHQSDICGHRRQQPLAGDGWQLVRVPAMQTAYPKFQDAPDDWVDLDHQQLADPDPRLQQPLELSSYAPTVTQPSILMRSGGLGWPSTNSSATARSHRLSSSRRDSLSPCGSPRCTHREVPSSPQCSTSMAINAWGNSSHGASGSKRPRGISLFSAASRSAASSHSTLGSSLRRT
jgi:hypothetical protein